VTRLPEPRQPGRVLDARLHLLDRQVLDVDGMPVCTLDDLELDGVAGSGDDGPIDGSVPVVITALLTGPVLGTRVFGGRPPASRWHRLPWSHVSDIGSAVHLGVSGSRFDATWLERWARHHIVGRIPGGEHDPEGSG
jgi:sporulation protein YlmC with PRC-barrel domain